MRYLLDRCRRRSRLRLRRTNGLPNGKGAWLSPDAAIEPGSYHFLKLRRLRGADALTWFVFRRSSPFGTLVTVLCAPPPGLSTRGDITCSCSFMKRRNSMEHLAGLGVPAQVVRDIPGQVTAWIDPVLAEESLRKFP